MVKSLQPLLSNFNSELESPLIRWSMLLIAVSLFLLVFVNPYNTWRKSVVEQIDRQSLQLLKQQRAVDSLPELREQQAVIRELNQGHSKLLLKETSDSSAQGRLMKLLSPFIKSNNLIIKGRRFDVGEVVPYLGAQVTIRLTLVGTSENVMAFLSEVTNSDVLLLASPVLIRRLQSESEIQVTVSGYRQLPDSELKRLSKKGDK